MTNVMCDARRCGSWEEQYDLLLDDLNMAVARRTVINRMVRLVLTQLHVQHLC